MTIIWTIIETQMAIKKANKINDKEYGITYITAHKKDMEIN